MEKGKGQGDWGSGGVGQRECPRRSVSLCRSPLSERLIPTLPRLVSFCRKDARAAVWLLAGCLSQSSPPASKRTTGRDRDNHMPQPSRSIQSCAFVLLSSRQRSWKFRQWLGLIHRYCDVASVESKPSLTATVRWWWRRLAFLSLHPSASFVLQRAGISNNWASSQPPRKAARALCDERTLKRTYCKEEDPTPIICPSVVAKRRGNGYTDSRYPRQLASW